MKPQLLISAATAGSGKTIFAIGLLRALKRRGLKVQPYKCGPDFIDAQHLSIGADTDSVNLDVWLSSRTHVQYIYNKYGEKAEICLTEGAGGLFDGYHRMQGSSAEMAQMLNLPVILLINARLAGYSVAPLIYGFKQFYAGVHIAGVIFNQISSTAHYARLREACMDAGVDCLGYVPYMESFRLPHKHTVLSQTNRQQLNELADCIAEQIEETVDINRLLNRCNRSFPCEYTLPYDSETEMDSFRSLLQPKLRIAIARDPAFNFVYHENIDRLSKIGRITYFSPLYSQELPEADLIYLPGGYPELFARQLHRRHHMMESLREYAESGGKMLAEGGGMVLLGHSLKSREDGTSYMMSNVFPIDFVMPSTLRLQSGYRKVTLSTFDLKGYEFRYLTHWNDETYTENLLISNLKGNENKMPFYRYKNVLASYTHWYWGDKDILKLWS